jgi:hypothetical protein
MGLLAEGEGVAVLVPLEERVPLAVTVPEGELDCEAPVEGVDVAVVGAHEGHTQLQDCGVDVTDCDALELELAVGLCVG